MKSFLAAFSLIASAFAASRTSTPSGCIHVAKSGGTYSTIQAAVNSLSTTSSTAQCIFISPGTYNEQVIVSARTAQLTIYGYTTDTTSYGSNQVIITNNLSQASGLTDEETGTLRIRANGFRMYNVNVKNTYGQGSQAIALSSYANSGFYGCAFTGYQDTVLTNTGYQVYVRCYISGATDFIFGQSSRAWFHKSDLRVLSASVGYLTANGNTEGGSSYYVFNKCSVAAADGETVSTGAYYLGRPWGAYAQVVFQDTSMTSVINAKGWSVWSTSDTRTCCVTFGEYGNTGAGASGTRASFATKLSSAKTISDILGSSYSSASYFDSSYYNAA